MGEDLSLDGRRDLGLDGRRDLSHLTCSGMELEMEKQRDFDVQHVLSLRYR
jgi:hypothetical protein